MYAIAVKNCSDRFAESKAACIDAPVEEQLTLANGKRTVLHINRLNYIKLTTDGCSSVLPIAKDSGATIVFIGLTISTLWKYSELAKTRATSMSRIEVIYHKQMPREAR
jgi:hypothetical protein